MWFLYKNKSLFHKKMFQKRKMHKAWCFLEIVYSKWRSDLLNLLWNWTSWTDKVILKLNYIYFVLFFMKHKCLSAAAANHCICAVSCLSFQTEDNVICHDKHIIHSSIMHLTSLFSLLTRDSGKKCSFLHFHIFPFFMPRFMENTGETGRPANAFHLGGMHLQPTDNNGLENTRRPRRSCLCSGNGVGPEASSVAATPSVPSL